ncbi:hypothetical protein BDI4_830009 [Burkholderia diffusa]|nr:hypothetical protein BDI4_830009 [Burkholderia diffusa]
MGGRHHCNLRSAFCRKHPALYYEHPLTNTKTTVSDMQSIRSTLGKVQAHDRAVAIGVTAVILPVLTYKTICWQQRSASQCSIRTMKVLK